MAGEGKGWISLYRSIQDHWLWQEKPFSKGQAWLDLLLLANHQDKKTLLGNELIFVKRGSFITSQKKLMERWGWGSEKTRKFLKLLDSDGMIKFKPDKKKTTIVILNYDIYQNQNAFTSDNSMDSKKVQNANRTQTECKQNDNRTSAETNNNDNNVNNDNNENNSSSTAANYIDFFNNNFHLITPFELQTLKSFESDGLNPQVIQLALKKAVENNARNMQYVKSILHSWLDKNIKTVEEVQAEQKQFKGSINKNNNNGFKKDNFNSYKQREYDYDELERKLLGWDKKGR